MKPKVYEVQSDSTNELKKNLNSQVSAEMLKHVRTGRFFY